MGVESGLLVPQAQREIETGICFFLRKGRILLFKRTSGPDAGRWGTYSADVRPGETFATAILRELDAESGVHARAAHLLMIAAIDDEHACNGVVGRHHTRVFVLTRWQGMPVPSAKWRYPEWFEIPHIGKMSLAGINMSPTQFVVILLRAAAT